LLIPTLGMLGAAAATAIALGLLTVAYYVVAQRLYPTPYDTRVVGGIVAAGVTAGSIGLIQVESAALEISVKLVALGAFLVVLRALGVIRSDHLREAGTAVAGVLRSREAV
jgi:O-antigen/teichoic acid export membrane protein